MPRELFPSGSELLSARGELIRARAPWPWAPGRRPSVPGPWPPRPRPSVPQPWVPGLGAEGRRKPPLSVAIAA